VTFDRPLTVVLGPNEAGKSTLLRFVRSVLYGFPTRKDPVERGEPVNGGRHGGTLLIRTSDGRRLLLSRYAETGRAGGRAQGSLTVREMDGTALPWPQPMLEKQVLGGVSERLFRQLFAITLDELHELLALQGEEIGNYLYQSGLAGGALLSNARRRLTAEMDKLYRPKGSAQEINRVLAQIKDLEAGIRRGRASMAEYLAKSQELERISRRLEELGNFMPALEAEEARLRSALDGREWWLRERLLLAEERELSLRLTHPGTPVLTEEDQHVWEALLRRREEARGRHENAKRDLLDRRTERDALQWDRTLLDHGDELEKLEAKRAACAARQEEFQAVRIELEQAADQAEAAARRISAEWTEDDLARLSAIAAEREALRRLQQDWADAAAMKRQLEAEAERLQRQKEALQAQQGSGGREGINGRAGTGSRVATGGRNGPGSRARKGSREGTGGTHTGNGAGWGLMAAAAAALAAVLLLAGTAWGVLPLPAPAVLALTAAAAVSAAIAGVLGVRQIRQRERAKALAEAGRQRQTQLDQELSALDAAMDREAQRAQQIRAEWESWRQRYRLPAALTPESVPDLLLAAEQGQAAFRRLARARQREDEILRQLEQFREAAAGLFTACPPPAPLVEDPQLAVSWLYSRLREQQAVQAEAAKLDAAIRSAEQAELAARQSLQEAENEIASRIAAAGEKDEASFALRLQIDARRRALQQERRELLLRLEAGRSPEQIREMMHLLENDDEAALLLKLRQAEEALTAARKEHALLLEQKGRLLQELHQLGQEAEQEDSRVRLSELESRLEQLAGQYAVLALSDKLLQQTKAIFEEQRQPEVLRIASGFFSRMTGGAYSRILVPADTIQVLAETKDKRIIDSAFLSRGTQEQLYLAMRFALAEAVSHQTPLPLLLDDLFVHFDEERLKSTIPVLEDISGRRQVILFTCHRHVAEAIGRGLPSAEVVRLEGREAVYSPAYGPGSLSTAR
jgi:uncharacterized protein YhaN